jgi:bifunctional NMN adenylyltransferase/nudix hydrolase
MTHGAKTLGVIVGRFQVAELHEGHRALIDTAVHEQERLLVVLGSTGGQPTDNDPLDIETRTLMIREAYPHALVRTLKDHPSDTAWSASLDRIVAEVAEGGKATLYGSRDCFLGSYHGALAQRTIPPLPNVNGTERRKNAGKHPLASPDFRQGAIYATGQRFPTSYQAVDTIIVRRETQEVLLGGKSGEDGLRFIGGFVDPSDGSLEAAAKREAYEETDGVELTAPTYLGSLRIDDHRYRKGPDGVMSAVFLAFYVFGAPRARDDLERLEWVRIEDVARRLAYFHLPLWNLVGPHLSTLNQENTPWNS